MLIALAAFLAWPAAADEGMWPYYQFPKDVVLQKYKFEVTTDFLDHLRQATVRIGEGSGAFVSPNGLLLTSRQIAAECLAKLSSAQHDYSKDGFYASTESAEPQCPGLEAEVLLRIEDVTNKVKGAADYPDATGTPRVEFGVVKGYIDRAGVAMPYASTFSGLFYRQNNEGPYQVPKRWVDLKSELSQTVPLDFVSTCDIGGGDYGSPTVNRAGDLVGVTFDGNLESLPGVYLYSDEQARAVHVAVGGILESLEKIYKATPLLRELGLTAPPPSASAGTRTFGPLHRSH